MRKKDVVAQLFSHDSDRPARLRPPMERSVAFVCDPRYAAKPNSRGRGADTCEYSPRRGRRDSIPGLPGPNFVATSGQRRKQMKKLERKGGSFVRTSVDRRSVFAHLEHRPRPHVPLINQVMNDIGRKLAARLAARLIIKVIRVFWINSRIDRNIIRDLLRKFFNI